MVQQGQKEVPVWGPGNSRGQRSSRAQRVWKHRSVWEFVYMRGRLLVLWNCECIVVWNTTDVELTSFVFPEAHSTSQGADQKGAGPSWTSPRSDAHGVSLGGQLQRPRAFSQSAVHTLERREKERTLDNVGLFQSRHPLHPRRPSEDVTSDEEPMVICEEGDDDVIGKSRASCTPYFATQK